jgi:hypothetical protein
MRTRSAVAASAIRSPSRIVIAWSMVRRSTGSFATASSARSKKSAASR